MSTTTDKGEALRLLAGLENGGMTTADALVLAETLDPVLVERFSAAPGVALANTYRGLQVESAAGLTQLVAIQLGARSYEAFQFIAGEPETIWPAFQDSDPDAGAVIISEPYAYRHELGLNDTIRLRTDRDVYDSYQNFRVVGVFTDYGSDQGRNGRTVI